MRTFTLVLAALMLLCLPKPAVARVPPSSHVLVTAYHEVLPDDLTSFYNRLLKTNADCAETFQAVASVYALHDYTWEDFVKALRSLRVAASSQGLTNRQFRSTPDDHLKEPTGEIVLYVNPTCDECARVTDLFVHVTEKVGHPAVSFRLIPNTEPDSVEASLALEYLGVLIPERFPEAVITTLQLLPEGRATIATVLKPYLPNGLLPNTPEWTAAEHHVAANIADANALDVSPPFAIYRAHLLVRYRTSGATYDTFRNENTLKLAITALDAFAQTGEPTTATTR